MINSNTSRGSSTVYPPYSENWQMNVAGRWQIPEDVNFLCWKSWLPCLKQKNNVKFGNFIPKKNIDDFLFS